MRTPLLTVLLAVFLSDLARADVFRWIEAERPVATNMVGGRANPFAPANDAERAKLSGGDWIGAYGPRRATLFAVYDVDVPAAGDYRFFARKFWKHGPYRVSVNNGPWTSVGDEVALLDNVELRPNVCANWTATGTFKLNAGPNRFRVESTSHDGAIAFDCFLVTDGPFKPRGTLKPDERLATDSPDWFAWDPPADAAGSPIDLRWMNEPFAGSDGRILARDGRFVHEKTGKPVRFWGVNFGPDIVKLGDRELDELAAMLASRGVNHVRLHGPIYAQTGATAGEYDERQAANVRRAVRVLKSHGIYSTLSIYFPMWLSLDESGGWPGYKNQTPFALLFFDPKFQALYRDRWKRLLTTPDPVSGVALKDEPAVLSLEMQNEDSLFFWTFQPYKTVPAPVAEIIERRFADWLTKRYGSPQKAVARWANDNVAGDDAAHSRVGIANLWRLVNVRDERSKDTVAFLFDVQRSFYASTRDYLRSELGSVSLVSASNWMTASDEFLAPLERASYLEGDLVDRHAYYTGVHAGPRAGHLISAGDTYNDRSALRFEQEKPGDAGANSWNPAFDTGVNDKPTMVSEIDWLEPNRYRTEAPLLCAAYGAQQDLDAMTFFAVAAPSWQPTLGKFSTMTPVALGQFPAAAMIYRQGLVDEGPLLVDARLNLGELLNLGGGLKGIDSKTAFVGQRRTSIDDGPTSRPTSPDLSRDLDAIAKTVRSASGQLSLDYGHGVLTIDAPQAKALVGFLDARGEGATLGPLTIRSSMPYGAIAVVALDGKPIGTSSKLLVQAMSEQRNAGWKTIGEPTRTIESFGTAPIVVRNLAGVITFGDGSTWAAQPIGPNGQANGEAMPASATLTLQPATPYYLLTRR